MELPDEILLQIMGYLSTKDILSNMAPVAKRFYLISQDPNLINRIQFKSFPSRWIWNSTERRKEKYHKDFFEVFKNAQKLKTVSLYLDPPSMRNFNLFLMQLMLPSVNHVHQCLEEIYIKFNGVGTFMDLLDAGYYLSRCPKLKKITIENFCISEMKLISNGFSSFNSNSVQELHLLFDGFFKCDVGPEFLKKLLKILTTNMTNIQYLGLALNLVNSDYYFCNNHNRFDDCNSPYTDFFQKISSEKKIRIEIRNLETGSKFLYV